jgi:hypothetical protein
MSESNLVADGSSQDAEQVQKGASRATHPCGSCRSRYTSDSDVTICVQAATHSSFCGAATFESVFHVKCTFFVFSVFRFSLFVFAFIFVFVIVDTFVIVVVFGIAIVFGFVFVFAFAFTFF